MATGTLARVTFEGTSGMVEDRVVNDFAFNGNTTDPVVRASIFANIQAFYNANPAGPTDGVYLYLSQEISRAALAARTSLYDISGVLGGGSIGSPVEDQHWTLAPPGADTASLPSEVAVCLSFHADYAAVPEVVPVAPVGPAGDIHPRSRRRGRVFIGPLQVAAAANNGSEIAVPSSGITTSLIDAAVALDDTSGPGGAGNWCVWSRKDAVLRPVTRAWVDDAFDTQRRRGRKPTVKNFAF